jgi:hypothetical protein
MKQKIIFAIAFAVMMIWVLLSCQKEINGNIDQGKPHTIKVYLTDHDTPVFDSVFIDFQRLEVKLEVDTLPNGGWVELNINAGVYNILRFRNGLDTLFATGTLPNARIRKIRLTLGQQNSAMKNGQSFPLRVNDNDRQVVVNIENANFEIIPPNQVLFWIDFDASRSIQVDNSGSGNNNGYRLKSKIKIFTHRNTGRIEGKVLPLAASPIVMAIGGADTATAIPDANDGKFKIIGLDAGSYTVFIDANNNYRDTTIHNVIVRRGEDTRLPDILLRQ